MGDTVYIIPRNQKELFVYKKEEDKKSAVYEVRWEEFFFINHFISIFNNFVYLTTWYHLKAGIV